MGWPNVAKGITASQTRGFNRRLVLSTVRMHEPVSRAEVARLTGLTAPTVGRLVQELIEDGLVSQLGRRSQGLGQPPIALGINRAAAHTVGLHLDHTMVTGVLTDLGGEVEARAGRGIDRPKPAEGLRLLVEVYEELLSGATLGTSPILGVGLVTGGPLDVVRGRILRGLYLPDWSDVPLRDELARAVGQAVFFDNNATAGAVGEHFFGAAQNERDFLYVYLGHGVGGGIFADGHVHRGASLNAGEFGHVIVEPGGLACTCGSRGCLETVASGFALRRDLGADAYRPEHVRALHEDGDPRLAAWLERATRALSHAVVSSHNLLDVEAVVIGGNLPGRLMDTLIAGVRLAVDAMTIRGRLRRPAVRPGALGEDAAALGAATLPMYEAFVPVPAHARRRGRLPSHAAEGVIG